MSFSHTTSRSGSNRSARRGAALVASLLLIVVLAIAGAGTFGVIGSEGKAIGDLEAHTAAYDIARSAYDQFMASPVAAIPAFTSGAWTGPDSALFTFKNGYAYVLAQRVRPTVDGKAAVYLIRSRGVRTTYRSGNTPVAERIFAQYAHYQKGMPVIATWTSLSGLKKNGGSGIISGGDACGQEPTIGGVGVPTIPGYIQVGGTPVPSGSPNIIDLGSQQQANSTVPVDWAGIVAGTALPPDVKIPANAWPSFADPNYWPVIYVDQLLPWNLPTSGRGLLIVRRNMIIGGSIQWDGVILAGGTIMSLGNNTFNGAILSGLNMLIGEIVPPSDLGTGSKTFLYNSCAVANATARLRGLAPLRNTTVDNWPSY